MSYEVFMSIGKRVAEAIQKMDENDAEGALYQICSTIDVTAKNELGKGGRSSYKSFLHSNMDLITAIAFGGTSILNLHLKYEHPNIETDEKGCCTFQDIIYHAVRCGMYHEASISENLRFVDGGRIQVEDDYICLPSALIYGLIICVVTSPANKNESLGQPSILNLLGVPLLVDCVWGKREELRWLMDSLKETRPHLRRPQDNSDEI